MHWKAYVINAIFTVGLIVAVEMDSRPIDAIVDLMRPIYQEAPPLPDMLEC